MSGVIAQTLTLLRKDLQAEIRNPGVLYTLVLFAAMVVVIFAFAFVIIDDQARAYGPGIIWVAMLFAATLGTSRVFDREQQHGCFDALLHCTPDPRAIFYAKTALSMLFATASTMLIVPLAVIFLDLPLSRPVWAALPLLLGLVGFCFIGTLFGALMARLAFREVLFPLIVFPLVVPLLICGVKGTSLAFVGAPVPEIRSWCGLMFAFDLVFVFGTAWVFPLLVRHRG